MRRSARGRVCDRRGAVFYVLQPFALETWSSLLPRPAGGASTTASAQYARGDEMNVWFVPPGSRAFRAASRAAR